MKKIILIVAVIAMSSCGVSNQMMIPKAVNTVSTASFSELRLQRSDYEVINTVESEAAIVYKSNRSGTNFIIQGTDEDFTLHYTYSDKRGWSCEFSGIAKLGYLNNDYTYSTSDIFSPEDVARRLAMYRAINKCRAEGGDGLIEPTISTSIEQTYDKSIVLKSTVIAKIIKLKTDN